DSDPCSSRMVPISDCQLPIPSNRQSAIKNQKWLVSGADNWNFYSRHDLQLWLNRSGSGSPEKKVCLASAICRDSHLHGLLGACRCRGFVPGDDGVLAGWKTLDGECAILSTDGEERTLHDADKSSHPRVLIALHRNQNLRAGKALLNWWRAIRLRLIPLG